MLARSRRYSGQRYEDNYLEDFLPVDPWYEQSVEDRWFGESAHQHLKRLVDLGLCLVALPFVVPILALCCLAVKLDSPGPLFFAQQRTGLGGRRFKMYKLRTMLANAEELKAKYM